MFLCLTALLRIIDYECYKHYGHVNNYMHTLELLRSMFRDLVIFVTCKEYSVRNRIVRREHTISSMYLVCDCELSFLAIEISSLILLRRDHHDGTYSGTHVRPRSDDTFADTLVMSNSASSISDVSATCSA